MKNILRIGVIGCARIAEKYTLSAIRSSEHLCLAAIASRSKEKAEKFAKMYECEPVWGYENMLVRKDIDVVYIPLLPNLHEKWAVESLKAGKHVLNEKPFATNLSSAKTVVGEARDRNLLVMENYMFIHHPQHAFVKDVIESGAIGEIRLFKGSFGFPPLAKNDFRYDKNSGGGALLDAGGYPIRAARFFLGDNLTGIGANMFIDKVSGVDIYGAAMFRNDANQVAQISFGFDNYYQCNYMIWGSKGAITVKRAYTIPPWMEPEVTVEKQGLVKNFTLPPENHFQLMLDYFCKEVLNDKNYESHYSSIIEQARLLEYARNNSC